MANIVPLDSAQHQQLRLVRSRQADGAHGERFVQIVMSEIVLLAADHPILFSKDAETGGFYCGAMRGFDPGEDLLAGRISLASPPPLALQRAGFYVGESGLGVDLDSPRLTDDAEGEALFGVDGQPLPPLQEIAAALMAFRSGIEATQAFIRTLLELGLIEPVEIGLSFDDGSRWDIEGLYTISQDKVRALPDDIALDLFRRDYLLVIYGIIASFRQIHRLARLKNEEICGFSSTSRAIFR